MAQLKRDMQDLVDLFDDDPDNWTQNHSYDTNKNGQLCWCIAGGVWHITLSEFRRDIIMGHLRTLLPKKYQVMSDNEGIFAFNDYPTRKFWEIKRFLRRALEAAE